jgi:hypothetical protein
MHLRLGSGFILRAWAILLFYLGSKIMIGIGVMPAGLAHKPCPHGLRLLVYVVKARARMPGSGLGLTLPYFIGLAPGMAAHCQHSSELPFHARTWRQLTASRTARTGSCAITGSFMSTDSDASRNWTDAELRQTASVRVGSDAVTHAATPASPGRMEKRLFEKNAFLLKRLSCCSDVKIYL